MGAFVLAPTRFRARDVRLHAEEGAAGSTAWAGWRLPLDALGFSVLQVVAPTLSVGQSALHGQLSPMSPLALTERERSDLEISPQARFCAFSYPVLAREGLDVPLEDSTDADLALLTRGGFLFFDERLALKDVRALVASKVGDVSAGRPGRWRASWTAAVEASRWHPVLGPPSLQAAGARYFAWLKAGETLGGPSVGRLGGFAFLFHEPTDIHVPEAQHDVYFDLEGPKVRPPCSYCHCPLEWSDFDGGCYSRGWSCENVERCGQSRTCAGRSRWFCPACQADFCDACFWELPGGAQD